MFDKFRLTPAKYQRITYLSVLLLSLIIVTGAAVRLTGSGLGCSDWPTCEEDQLVAEIDDVHAMVEFVNRVITGIVSLAVILAVLGSLFREPKRKDLMLLLNHIKKEKKVLYERGKRSRNYILKNHSNTVVLKKLYNIYNSVAKIK